MSDFQGRKVCQAVRFGAMSLDFRTMELSRAGRPIGITLGEFKVLKFLVSRPRTVVSRKKLITSAWPKRHRSTHRAVDNCIAKLRQKIESNPNRFLFLQTVRGVWL
jgi:DNA-binding response OmpR family regulator